MTKINLFCHITVTPYMFFFFLIMLHINCIEKKKQLYFIAFVVVVFFFFKSIARSNVALDNWTRRPIAAIGA